MIRIFHFLLIFDFLQSRESGFLVQDAIFIQNMAASQLLKFKQHLSQLTPSQISEQLQLYHTNMRQVITV
jgi:hypothetical protein